MFVEPPGGGMSSDDKSLPPIVEQIYDIVVEPGRLEQLCDVWVQHLQAAGESDKFGALGQPNLLPHVERVSRVECGACCVRR